MVVDLVIVLDVVFISIYIVGSTPRLLKEAAEAALEMKNEDEFGYVLSRLGGADKQVAEQVRAMRGQLGARR